MLLYHNEAMCYHQYFADSGCSSLVIALLFSIVFRLINYMYLTKEVPDIVV